MKNCIAWLVVITSLIGFSCLFVGVSVIRSSATDLAAMQNKNKPAKRAAKPAAKASSNAGSMKSSGKKAHKRRASSGSLGKGQTESKRSSVGKPGARSSGAGAVPTFTNNRETGWDVLVAGQEEAEGYGLYSYLLLGSPPTTATRELYLHAILACLEELPYIEELNVPRNQLNVTYMPVLVSATDDIIDGARMSLASWVLRNYDYARARILLRALPRSHPRGPYLVSVPTPLSHATTTVSQYLFQDMTLSTPDLVVLWIELFRDRAAQDRFWEETWALSCRRYAVELRDDIAIAANAAAIILPAYKSVRSFLRKFLLSSP